MTGTIVEMAYILTEGVRGIWNSCTREYVRSAAVDRGLGVNDLA